jgi:hypothetical protein
MKKILIALSFFLFVLVGKIYALELSEIAIAQSVQDRIQHGIADSFPVSVEKLYCYTKLSGGKEGDIIIHRWKKDGIVIREFQLKIGGPTWRTYSCKWLNGMRGKWSVEIICGNKVLRTKNITIQ